MSKTTACADYHLYLTGQSESSGHPGLQDIGKHPPKVRILLARAGNAYHHGGTAKSGLKTAESQTTKGLRCPVEMLDFMWKALGDHQRIFTWGVI